MGATVRNRAATVRKRTAHACHCQESIRDLRNRAIRRTCPSCMGSSEVKAGGISFKHIDDIVDSVTTCVMS